MSEQSVTIREHIRAGVLAAGPVGLSMAALAGAVLGPWTPRDVKDTVRRLRRVGELTRRHDGTFVLSERAAKRSGRPTAS